MVYTLLQDSNLRGWTCDQEAARKLGINLDQLDQQQRTRFDSIAPGVALPRKTLRKFVLDNPSVVR